MIREAGKLIMASVSDPTSIYQLIMTAIGSLGFPIVACIMMYKQNEKLEQRHEDESRQFAKAIENNTLAIQHLADMMEKGE